VFTARYGLDLYVLIEVSVENEYIHNIGQSEAQHKKYVRMKVGGGEACDC